MLVIGVGPVVIGIELTKMMLGVAIEMLKSKLLAFAFAMIAIGDSS